MSFISDFVSKRHQLYFRKNLILTFLLITLISTLTFAQAGKIAGKVVDEEFGDGLIGANVIVEGTSIGAATDIEGNFLINNVPAGTYNVVFSMIGFEKKKVTGVVITDGKVTRLEVTLGTESFETDEVVVTATAVEDSEAGLLIKRQKSASVSDAISAEQISRSGSGDAAAAVKQVVGASVVGGKYVYVRGLGERYSSTQMNGAELPSSDPNKKAFQLDLLPASLLENITTIKTFTPDKPGSFSGGIVDVGTKTFPEKFVFKVSSSIGYHSKATFNDDYLTSVSGDNDWLGVDDGTRELPDAVKSPDIQIPNSVSARFNTPQANALDGYTKVFAPTFHTFQKGAPMNSSFGFTIGNRIQLNEKPFGYLFSLTYGRSFSFYDDGEYGQYSLPAGSAVLNPEYTVSDREGSSEANLGGLLTLAYNIAPEHQISANAFYTRSGTMNTRSQDGKWPHQFGIGDNRVVHSDVIEYIERDVLNYQINGEHSFPGLFDSKIDWSVSLGKTTQNEPDRRLIFHITDFTADDSSYTITGSNFDDPSRFFRELEDNSNTFKVDYTLPFEQWSGLKSKLKLGYYEQHSDREFTERLFTYNTNNELFQTLEGDIEAYFQTENIGISSVDTLSGNNLRYNFGTNIEENSKPRNNYSGDQKITAGYAMIELPILDFVRFIGGVRYETTDLTVESEDLNLAAGKIKEDDLLPSANLIFAVTDNMNLRLAATKTLARPNFREIAPFSAKDFIQGVEKQGNPDLKRTLIENYDLRWEWFMRPGQIVALSLFHKIMHDPIELGFAQGSTAANQIVQYTNVDQAIVQGLEFEARITLDWLLDDLKYFSIGGNLSLVNSNIDIPEDELLSRLAIDSTADSERELQGQSPYIVNLDFTYMNWDIGTSINLHYNIFGERLSKVTTGIIPDIYELPQPQLDLTINQEIFETLSAKLSVKNLLDSEYKEVYRFNGEDYVHYSYKRGMSISFGVTYKL